MPKTLASFVYLVAIAVAVMLNARIALYTAFNAHPDEMVHVDAFCYFGAHWWPPPLDDDRLQYSPDGWSRVYNGEVVYVVWGKLGHWIPLQHILPSTSRTVPTAIGPQETLDRYLFLPIVARSSAPCVVLARSYRLFNTVLLATTLLVVFRMRRHALWVGVLGWLLVSIPQVSYLYGYANSDAWGLSFAIFLVLVAVAGVNGTGISWRMAWGLGVLTGMVVLSKSPFWASIPFAYLILGYGVWTRRSSGEPRPWLRALKQFMLIAGIAIALAAPLKVVYPLTQGNFAEKAHLMREARARWDFSPSHPESPGYLLAHQGVRFVEIASNQAWWMQSAKSFYGKFGYMAVESPAWVYGSAGAILILESIATLGFMLFAWRRVPPFTRLMVSMSLVFIGLSILASLYNSWTYDFQPQGRYLFPALAPLALLTAGTLELEPRWLRMLRSLGLAVLYALCIYVIGAVVLSAPVLQAR